MATVTMIPARKTVGARKKTEDAPKLRVAAYCRKLRLSTIQNS